MSELGRAVEAVKNYNDALLLLGEKTLLLRQAQAEIDDLREQIMNLKATETPAEEEVALGDK